MKKIELVKTAAGIIVSVGVSAIVGNTIKYTTPDTAGTIKKVCIGIGSFVLSSMVVDSASEYAGKKIDKAVNEFKGMMAEDMI